jgi:hypothetical protein
MKSRWPIPFLLFSPLVAVLVCSGRLALARGNNAAPAAAPSAAAEDGGPTNSVATGVLSPGVGEILKMADAGVSTEVITTYIECSPTPPQPTDADMIALKQHKVPDEIATLLLKRGAQVRVAVAQARAAAVERVRSSRNVAAGGFDPESHEYFQYYHLQPRALAFGYQRFSPYYYPSYPNVYRYGPPFGPPYLHRRLY